MGLEFDNFPLQDTIDAAILMHRDVHFGGNFGIMLAYYQRGGKGVCPDFKIERIEALAELEAQNGQNLAPWILTGADAEKVARAKKHYQELRELFEKPDSKLSCLIADLILSEEEDPKKEIEAIVKEKEKIVPLLLELLRSEIFYDPLFPGYGKTPSHAAKCLGMIGDKRAIISLFEGIGEGDFFDEDNLLQALCAIGEPAKTFLLHVVQSRPFTFDNERAAIALISFKEDPLVAALCFKLLNEPDFKSRIPFANYLVLVCEGLQDKELQRQFCFLAKDPSIPREVAQDMNFVSKKWGI